MDEAGVARRDDLELRFIGAYNDIDRELRRRYRLPISEPFAKVLARARDSDPVVRSHYDDLHQLADLRNAIVHWRKPDKLIAVPHEDTVKQLERIRDDITHPATVWELFRGNSPVESFAELDGLKDVLRLMHERKYSQFPVYRASGEYVGLLTEATIARWLAAYMHDGIVDIDDAAVGTVLAVGGTGRCEFVKRNTVVAYVRELFAKTAEEPLQAVIITESGSRNEAPLAIITAWDLFRDSSR